MRNDVTRESNPTMLEEYRLVRPLGRGAMGEVWLAHDTLLDRAVALKMILATAPSIAAQKRFRAEARAIARLTDPNVVTIFRVGEADGKQFLVSEYIRGTTLAKLETPLEYEELLRISIDLSRGLAAAHKNGVLHRDIKADNALIDENGVVKLVDFGLAKLLHGQETTPKEQEPKVALQASQPADRVAATGPLLRELGQACETLPPTNSPKGFHTTASVEYSEMVGATLGAEVTQRGACDEPFNLTQAGALVGTPRYLAPECWRAETATAASDIYSLGVLLYELATGEVPHPQENIEALRDAVCNHEVLPLSEAQGIEPRFALIVQRCLRKDPEARFATGDELCAALELLRHMDAPDVIDPNSNPYRGLSSYTSSDRALFFGRSRETHAICSMLASEPLVIIAGESGVGKSSICLAAVVPHVLAHGLGDERTWSSISFRPGLSPLSALADALGAHTGVPASELLCEITEQPSLISRWLRNHLGNDEGLVLVIDQLEELVTQSGAEEAEVFRQLLQRLSAPTPGIRVLATARGDFLTRIASFTGLSSALARSLYILAPLEGSNLRAAIRGPAERMGVSFECEELVEDLATQVEAARGALPLLQLVLAQLWTMRDTETLVIQAASLQELGGLSAVLQSYADGVLASMSPRERATAKQQLMELVSVDGTAAVRSTSALERIGPGGRSSLAALIESRLVVATGGKGNEATACQLAHDTLIAKWSQLQAWLNSDARKRELVAALERLAEDWQRLGGSRDGLLRPTQLAEFGPLLQQTTSLSSDALALLQRSKALHRRQRWWRLAVLLAIPTLIAGVYWVTRERSIAEQDKKISQRLSRAELIMQDAARARKTAEPLRMLAYPLFDVMSGPETHRAAEEAWGLAVKATEPEIDAYHRASLEVEAALLMGGDHGRAKRLYSEILLQRALSSERYHREADVRQLLARLATYDNVGEQLAKWNAQGTFSMRSKTAGVQAKLYRYELDHEQRYQKVPAAKPSSLPATWTLDPGSYIVELAAAKHEPVRYPLVVERGDTMSANIELPALGSVPEDFVYIPEGRFLYGSEAPEETRKGFYAAPLHHVEQPAFMIAKHETTMQAWINYANEGAPVDLPKADFWGAFVELKMSKDYEWSFLLKDGAFTFEAPAEEKILYSVRDRQVSHDWLKFPVVGVSAKQAKLYATWLRKTPGLETARLCTEHEFERAARGADARRYPHAEELAPSDANHESTYGRKDGTMGPNEIGSHPASDSPFGVADLVGNASEFYAIDDDHVAIRGGGWSDPKRIGVDNRAMGPDSHKAAVTGFRICLTPKL